MNEEKILPHKLSGTLTAKALSRVYSSVVNVRNFAYDKIPALSQELNSPVISIGGIRAGGVGKTPVAELIGRYLVDNRHNIAFLSRGYGRVSKSPVIVPPAPCDLPPFSEVGDEPWMLRKNIPQAWLGISANRVAAAKKILRQNIGKKTVFILDDGFQHRRVRRSLDIVCLSENVFDDRMLPVGFLRESVKSIARRADMVFVIGAEERLKNLQKVAELVAEKTPAPCAVLLQYAHSWVEAKSGHVSERLPFDAPIAITGIARPERFLNMLRAQSVAPSAVHSFGDHHNFKITDIERIHNVYSNKIVTTEKDAVRLMSPDFRLDEIWYLKLGLRFADNAMREQVMSKIDGAVTLQKPFIKKEFL